MPHLTTILLGAAVLLFISPAAAQNAPATFRADPSVYKLIYEDQNIRVISATWAKACTTSRTHTRSHRSPMLSTTVPSGFTRPTTRRETSPTRLARPRRYPLRARTLLKTSAQRTVM